jgi:catechol 2,3-dioxygenase-like lactoylglutathione lyase family enzyme
MIRGIHHFAVHVRDLERMSNFYKEAFGFQDTGQASSWSDSPVVDEIIDVRNSAARTTMLSAGNCYVELFQFSAPPPGSTTALRPYDHGYTHFCVDVTDIGAEIERLTKLGMNFDRPHGPAKAVDAGTVLTVYGRDPEGNVIEIQQTNPGCVFDVQHLPKAKIAAT